MDKRRFLAISGSAAAASLAAPWIRFSRAQDRPDALSVMTWGGNWAEVMRSSVDSRFEQLTGIPVVQDLSNPAQRITKLKVNLDNQIYDAVQLPDTLVPMAISQGVIQPFNKDSANLANLRDVYPSMAGDHWVAQMFTAIGITYNANLVETPPKSWADLWNPEYRGRIVLPEIAHSIGPYIVPIGALANGGELTDAEMGFEMLARMVELNPIWSNNTDAIINAFTNEEAVIGIMYKNHTLSMQERGVPVEWVYPEEGAISLSWGWSIAKNTKNLEFAEKYVNISLNPESQIELMDYANYPGSNRKVLELYTEEQRQKAEFTDDEIANLIHLDHQFMSDQRSDWTNRWNRLVAG